MGRNLFEGMSRRDALKMAAAAGIGVTLTPMIAG